MPLWKLRLLVPCLLLLLVSDSCTPQTGRMTFEDVVVASAHRSNAAGGKLKSPDLGEEAELDDYLLYAAMNNPGLKAAFKRWRAAVERIPQAKSLPDPHLSYGYFIERVETRVGPQRQRIGLKQAFPWFGKLDLRGDVASAEARAAFHELAAERLDVINKVKDTYYELYYLSRAIAVTRESVKLLEYIESSARARYRVSNAQYSDVIRAQVELGKLEDKLRRLIDLKEPIAAKLNAVLNRRPDAPGPSPADYKVTAPEAVESLLKEVPSVDASTVFADRITGKPYLEIDIDRLEIARYGINVRRVQDVIEVALGGRQVTTTIEGRERYAVRVRYLRELRDQFETIGRVLVSAPDGKQIPLEQLSDINYVRGPQSIKSEDTFLVGYVIFDKRPEYGEVEVVEACQRYLKAKIADDTLEIPPGVSYEFAGSYKNQIRAEQTLKLVLPLAIFLIFLILYLQFRQVSTTLIVFSGIAVAWAGGFILIWLYGEAWFLDFAVFGTSMRDIFQVHTINLSVAVWVGFLALFGIATDDGVVMATYLKQQMKARKPTTVAKVRETVVQGGLRRIRPCLMTTATILLALLAVLTSTGRGADVMVPMAIPSVGGMALEVITMFVVPVLYCIVVERNPAISDHHIKERKSNG